MNTVNIYPNNSQTQQDFRNMSQAPNEDTTIVEMNEVTSKDIKVIWASVEALAARWRGGANIHFPGMPTDRKEFWGTYFAINRHVDLLPVAKEFIESTSGQGKTAIDLGCGNSPATKLLLEKGWHVIAVDYSKPALDMLASQHKDKIASGQLEIIEEDASKFEPSAPVDLVIAADSLPYLDPSKFRATWSKIHDVFLKEKGFLVGSLFRAHTKPELTPVMNVWKEMGAWFLPDRRMVKPLLTHSGYEIKTCKYRIDAPNEEAACIQFIAEKKTH